MTIASIRGRVKAEIRQEILATAREFFVQDGYANFSLRKVAEKLGCAPSAIYRHFRNKNAIYDALVEESFAALFRATSAVKDLPGELPQDRLRRGLLAYVDFGLRHPDHYRFAFVMEMPDNPRINTKQAFEGMKGRIRRCIDTGYFPERDLDFMAQSLWAAIHGITSLLLQKPYFGWVDQSALIRHAVDAAIAGLCTNAESKEVRK